MTSESQKSPSEALASLRIDRSQPTKRFPGWKWLLAMATVGGVGFAVMQYRSNQNAAVGTQAEWMPEIMQSRVPVRLASVTVQQGRAADAVVVATGYLESRRQAKIGARAAGRIDKVTFEEGQRVQEEELLAELEHADLDASLEAAIASVQRAKASIAEQEIAIEQALVDRTRLEQLWNKKSVSKTDLDQVRFAYQTAVARKQSLLADLAVAKAQQEQTRQLRENMFIRAPFAGTVISKDAEVGESILPGGMGGGSGRGSVATIADLEHLEIECDVQEAFIARVREGQEAEIAVDAVPDKRYCGMTRKIIPMGDRARATIKVQVAITDADELLFPEMAGTVYFLPEQDEQEVQSEERIFCPTSSVDRREPLQAYVWIVDADKRARRIAVQVGDERDGRTEVFAGLAGGERVVVNPQDLQVGGLVEVSE